MVTAEHTAARPSWDCARCEKPWPCDPAREGLAAEFTGSELSIFMSIDMAQAARELPAAQPSELWERFLSWT